jgi:hypothetical protein
LGSRCGDVRQADTARDCHMTSLEMLPLTARLPSKVKAVGRSSIVGTEKNHPWPCGSGVQPNAVSASHSAGSGRKSRGRAEGAARCHVTETPTAAFKQRLGYCVRRLRVRASTTTSPSPTNASLFVETRELRWVYKVMQRHANGACQRVCAVDGDVDGSLISRM